MLRFDIPPLRWHQFFFVNVWSFLVKIFDRLRMIAGKIFFEIRVCFSYCPKPAFELFMGILDETRFADILSLRTVTKSSPSELRSFLHCKPNRSQIRSRSACFRSETVNPEPGRPFFRARPSPWLTQVKAPDRRSIHVASRHTYPPRFISTIGGIPSWSSSQVSRKFHTFVPGIRPFNTKKSPPLESFRID